ncbi:SDR family oxidoreductase [Celerinatantimonas sp. MCCC 1A17872]|uniref:SDR family oxidoreductase n=1 Tax=Celerinatantimonas sp. MCCC 1A17872 TaxID=3177514 RepID=UPI0038BFBE8F
MTQVFVTGATGFIGQSVVKELIEHDYEVLGLTRSEQGEQLLKKMGATPIWGDLQQRAQLVEAAQQADAVIHLAFNHDFSTFLQNCEDDNQLIQYFGQALKGTEKRLIVTSGCFYSGEETNFPKNGAVAHNPRVASDKSALAIAKDGVNSTIVGLPQIHDTHRFGLISWLINIAQQKGKVGFIGDGQNFWAATHRSDVARAYRLALENGQRGYKYMAVAENDLPFYDIAQAIGKRLDLPVEQIADEEVSQFFGPMSELFKSDLTLDGQWSKDKLHWQPVGPSLFDDIAGAIIE